MVLSHLLSINFLLYFMKIAVIFKAMVFTIMMSYKTIAIASCIITVPINGNVEDSRKLTSEFITKLSTKQSKIKQIENDQFFTYNPQELNRVLQSISLKNSNILDIGAGTGIISNLILNQNVKKLTINEYDSNICYNTNKNVQILKGDFRKINFDKIISRNNFGIISNPPYNLLSDLRDFIDYHKISNVILIIPAWRYSELFTDFQIVGALKNTDFLPAGQSKNDVHLIIQKGFVGKSKLKAKSNQITIGRQLMDIENFTNIVRKKFSLSNAMCKQIPEHLGGKVFESLDVAIEALRYKEKLQLGNNFNHIKNAEWAEQQDLIKRHKKSFSQEELKLLSAASFESSFAHAAWLAINHAVDKEKIVIGQRTEINQLLSNNLINNNEILDIPSHLWNWLSIRVEK